MICSVLINQAELENICQYKLVLRQILQNQSSIRTKIVLVSSFKEHLKLVYQNKLKKAQRKSIQVNDQPCESKNKGMLSSLSTSLNYSRQLPALLMMKSHHRSLISSICNEYEIRNDFSVTLYQLQKQIDKATSKYQRCIRQHDLQGQSKAIVSIDRVQQKVKHLLDDLLQMKQSIFVKYQLLKDNINILKVKYSVLKKQVSKSITTKTKYTKVDIPSLVFQDENKNQILVNI